MAMATTENGEVPTDPVVENGTEPQEQESTKPKAPKIKRPEKPDKAAMEEQVKALEEKIDSNRKRIDEIKGILDSKVSSRSDSNKDFRRLRDQHASILLQIRAANDDKQKLWQELKSADEARKKMKDDAKALREKLPFVKVEQIDEEIRKVEHRMQHSTLPLNEEKKLILQIKDLTKSRDFVKSYSDRLDEIAEDEKGREAYFEKIKSKEAQITSLKQQEVEKKKAIDEAKTKEIAQQSEFPSLVQEKQKLFEEINGIRGEIKNMRDGFWAKHKEWFEQEKLWREQQKEEQYKAYLQREAWRKEREEIRKKREAENYVEPFTDEIIFCDQLTHYLQKLQGPVEGAGGGGVEVKEVKEIVAPKGFGNMVVSKKNRGDEELDGLFMGLGAKKGKGKGKNARPKSEKISLSLDSVTSFTKVGVAPPPTMSEISETLEKLKEKKEHFQQLQIAERERRSKGEKSEVVRESGDGKVGEGEGEMDMRRRMEWATRGDDQRRQERAEAELESLREDLGEEFRLPIGHRPTNNLDRENLEQASLDTQIPSDNIGFKLLQKMGWKGKGLGKKEQGIVEPVRAGVRDAKLGVGKQEEDDFYTAEENVQRKKLEVEIEETEEMARKRETEAAKEERVRSDVKEILRPFFCALCQKQYRAATEYETHLSSYDHNHKKRFRDMKEQQTANTREDRKKREQVREERELARLAQLAAAQRQQQKEAIGSAEVESGQGGSEEGGSRGGGSEGGGSEAPAAAVPQPSRGALKFGFGAKTQVNAASKKAKVAAKMTSIFGDDDD